MRYSIVEWKALISELSLCQFLSSMGGNEPIFVPVAEFVKDGVSGQQMAVSDMTVLVNKRHSNGFLCRLRPSHRG